VPDAPPSSSTCQSRSPGSSTARTLPKPAGDCHPNIRLSRHGRRMTGQKLGASLDTARPPVADTGHCYERWAPSDYRPPRCAAELGSGRAPVGRRAEHRPAAPVPPAAHPNRRSRLGQSCPRAAIRDDIHEAFLSPACAII
jgi:hypothetical protein